MDGQQKSVYLRQHDIEGVERHAARHGRSFSWALRDYLRAGMTARQLGENLKELREMREGRWESE